jgi:dipeptidyl aminopeptidase/acylaminoacyl peptidase
MEIERFEAPLFLSHGTQDATWSVEMTRRLSDRLNRQGRNPEVHLYEGEGHGFSSDAENRHHELLIDFFARHLGC